MKFLIIVLTTHVFVSFLRALLWTYKKRNTFPLFIYKDINLFMSHFIPYLLLFSNKRNFQEHSLMNRIMRYGEDEAVSHKRMLEESRRIKNNLQKKIENGADFLEIWKN